MESRVTIKHFFPPVVNYTCAKFKGNIKLQEKKKVVIQQVTEVDLSLLG